MTSYWKEVVYSAEPFTDLERRDAAIVFEWINLNLPVGLAKIDWGRVQGRHAHWKVGDNDELGALAVREICRRIQPGAIVEHVGDGLSPFGVLFDESIASEVIPALLEIPEHHYFLAVDRSWLLVATMEGDLDVLDRDQTGSAEPGLHREFE